jgi:hypothetical protein
MSKSSTVVSNRVEIFKDDKLTIGLELGDRFSHCALNGAGEVIREHRRPTTPKGIDERGALKVHC